MLPLLTSIYDNVGAAGGSHVSIADQNETWFVENLTGHTYLALKLSSSVAFMQPNIAAIGKIDLDDTERWPLQLNYSVARKAGTFVGDAAANVINLNASYNGDITSDRISSRPELPVRRATPLRRTTTTRPTLLSATSAVPVYSNIQLTKKFSVEFPSTSFRPSPSGQCGDCHCVPGERHPAFEHRHYRVEPLLTTTCTTPSCPFLSDADHQHADVSTRSRSTVTRSKEQPTEPCVVGCQKPLFCPDAETEPLLPRRA